MKSFRFIVFSLFFAAVFAVSISAQSVNKVGLINTTIFEDEKQGITKFINGRKSLNAEFKRDFDELTILLNRIQALEKEIIGLENQLKSSAPVNKAQLQATYTAKTDEYGKLGREYKFKQDDAKVRYERREQIVMGPIMLDIGNAMEEYRKQKAFSLLLDSAKLFNAGVLLAWDTTTDVTADFVKYYNARPATAVVNPTTK